MQPDIKNPSERHRRRRRNHVLLLRHCIRSTKFQVNLHLANDDNNNLHNLSDYTASPMPHWNVPEMYCTKGALDTIRRSGQFLMNNVFLDSDILRTHRLRRGLIEHENDDAGDDHITKHHITFNIISDTPPRNRDTAMALSLGLSEAAQELSESVISSGLSEVKYDRSLFNPLPSNDDENNVGGFECPKPYNPQELIDEITRRLDKIPPPQQLDLYNSLNLLQNIGGIGVAGPLVKSPADATIVINNKDDGAFEGKINVLKQFSEMVFYSRAGEIDPPFLPNITIDDAYRLLSWVHYMRSVRNVDNVKSAMRGVVLAKAVLDALKENDGDHDDEAKELYDTTYVTIFVGHDSNIDALATEFGLRWSLPPPYYQDDSGEYLPTPPGSSMYFVAIDAGENRSSSSVEDGHNDLELFYLYPVYLGKGYGAGSYDVNNTGSLDSVPMVLIERDDNMSYFLTGSDDTMKSQMPLSNGSTHTMTNVLNRRLLSMLDKYPEVKECYYSKASNHTVFPTIDAAVGFNKLSTRITHFIVPAITIVSSVLLVRKIILIHLKT